MYSQSVCDSASYAALQISFYPVSSLQLWCPRVAQGFKWNECSLLTSSVENKRPLSRLAVTQDKILNIDCQQLGTDYPLLEEWVCKSVSDYVCVCVCVCCQCRGQKVTRDYLWTFLCCLFDCLVWVVGRIIWKAKSMLHFYEKYY